MEIRRPRPRPLMSHSTIMYGKSYEMDSFRALEEEKASPAK